MVTLTYTTEIFDSFCTPRWAQWEEAALKIHDQNSSDEEDSNSEKSFSFHGSFIGTGGLGAQGRGGMSNFRAF